MVIGKKKIKNLLLYVDDVVIFNCFLLAFINSNTTVSYINECVLFVSRWVLDLQCGGSRNFLSAFKLAVENEEEIKHKISKSLLFS